MNHDDIMKMCEARSDEQTYDPKLDTEANMDREGWDGDGIPLPMLVAKGRVYIKNADGEFEQVTQANYWFDGEIRGVCSDGYEWNEDGAVTRDWRE